MTRHSCLYEGTVRHRRYGPKPHAFKYRVFMAYLDLDELDGVFRGMWSWSTRRRTLAYLSARDHIGDSVDTISDAVRDLVEERSGARPTGPIRMLTNLRYFGYCMNPVSFMYCFDEAGERVEHIVAEINNTPWKDRYCYVCSTTDDQPADRHMRFQFGKSFHVSPFMPMEQDYDWRFTSPDRTLAVHMENFEDGAACFDATLAMRRRAMSPAALRIVLAKYPFMTAQVILGIYWQAFRLWLKRTPYHSYPGPVIPPEGSAV
ncbi:MAG: DUF1365 domain-containing protein [Planctomycetota bacterium]